MKNISLFGAIASCALLAACQTTGSVSDVEIDDGMSSSEAVVIEESSSSSVEAMEAASSSVEAMDASSSSESSSSEAAM